MRFNDREIWFCRGFWRKIRGGEKVKFEKKTAAMMLVVTLGVSLFVGVALAADTRPDPITQIIQILLGIQPKIQSIENEISGINTDTGNIEDKIGGLDTKIDGVDDNVEAVQTKIDSVESKVDGLGTEIGSMEGKVDAAKNAEQMIFSDSRKYTTKADGFYMAFKIETDRVAKFTVTYHARTLNDLDDYVDVNEKFAEGQYSNIAAMHSEGRTFGAGDEVRTITVAALGIDIAGYNEDGWTDVFWAITVEGSPDTVIQSVTYG
jgi:hypothetical protein